MHSSSPVISSAETAARGPMQNAIKLFLADGVLTYDSDDAAGAVRRLRLGDEYCSQGAVDLLSGKINDFLI